MAKELHHPETEQIDLSAVLDALSEPTRREIVLRLVEQKEAICSSFRDCASKTNLTYHVARLREAGVIRVRLDGAYRFVSLRADDLEARFPKLLDTILTAAKINRGDAAS